MMKITLLILIAIGFVACNSSENPLAYQANTMSRGKAKFYVDESYKPLFSTLEYTFEGQLPDAHLSIEYVPENQALNDFFADRIETICISRDLTEAEKLHLKKRHIGLVSDLFAKDGLTLIVHPENPDSMLTMDEFKSILSGENPIQVFIDNANTANYVHCKKVLQEREFGKNIAATGSNEKVIDRIAKDKKAIGIIGMSWISDEDDPKVQAYLKKVRLVHVAKDKKSTYFLPYQAYVYTGEYPLSREMWLLNRAKRDGLNTGFTIFCVREKGQLIVHKSSLVANFQPPRRFEIITE